MTTSASRPNGRMNTEEIRSRIEQTREGLGHTIDAIEERLQPRRLAADAAKTMKTATMAQAVMMGQWGQRAMNDPTVVVNDAKRLWRFAKSYPRTAAFVGIVATAFIVRSMMRSRYRDADAY